MTQTEIGSAAPIVRDVPAALAFYRERLGFEVTFQGPEPNDIFFGIVQRGRAMFMFKEVGVEPMPNPTRDIGQGIAAWDAYIYVPDPDALAAEFGSCKVKFLKPLMNTSDNLRGFEIEDEDGYVLFFGRPNRADAAQDGGSHEELRPQGESSSRKAESEIHNHRGS
jgi:catechol 2,3-dioxygenase-like lactoylglutathione lyase family enzyme